MRKRVKETIIKLIAVVSLSISLMAPMLTYATESTFSETDLEVMALAETALQEILEEKEVMALVYLTDYYGLRSQPSSFSKELVRLSSGQQVKIQNVVMTPDWEAWAYVTCSVGGKEYTGYVNRQNLALSDEVFLDWEMEYGMNPALFQMLFFTGAEGSGEDQTIYPDIAQFPESYQAALTILKEAHPNWTFVKMNTGLDWNTVVAEELKGGRSLVYSTSNTAMKEGLFGQNWYYASEEALEYYLDPRNGLTEERIFQFEQLTYNESYHTEAAVQDFLNNTFMSGYIPQTDEMSYAHGITAIGREFNISPFHLASRVYQEQGSGSSPLISGTYPGYEGYYNYYNIGASGKTNQEVIENGLAYAKEQGWNSPYYSLHFGAKLIGGNYIFKGQDTLYLQKFDVDNSDGELYWHQYMQNIGAPNSEAANIRKLYQNAGSLDNTFVFKIPVYENMPESISEKPQHSNRVVLGMEDGYEDLQVYLDGEPVAAVKRNGYFVAEAPDAGKSTAVMYQYNENNVPVGMKIWKLEYDGSGYLVNELEGLQDLLSLHGFSIRITGRSGIRYKSGISQETKALLKAEGAEGYTLKEYGTLVLPEAMLNGMLLKIDTPTAAKGMSYGVDEAGNLVDKVLEQVNGRDRFASVLVGLPVNQYKTSVAFRAYAVLTKGGEDIVIYGPQNAKSIYDLAAQLLGMNIYPENSSPYVFLKQIISDADAYEAEKPSGSVSGGDVIGSVSGGDAAGSGM